MKDTLTAFIQRAESLMTTQHPRAKKARALIKLHLVLQVVLLMTFIEGLELLFYLSLTVYLFVTVQIIIHGLKLK